MVICVETTLRGTGLYLHLTDDAHALKVDGSNAKEVIAWQIIDGIVMAVMVNSTKQSMIMNTKLTVVFHISVFTRMIHTQFSTPIKVFHSDSGGEYLSDFFRQFLTSEGTLAQLSCSGAHAQNGVVERKHRHHIQTTRTLLVSSFVPTHFWGEVVSTAVYLINRQPSSKLSNKFPSEVLFSTPPSYDNLRVFGCTCYVLLAPRERTKLIVQSVECVFL
jgi:hypothetical protein